jgi:hypothetical protein
MYLDLPSIAQIMVMVSLTASGYESFTGKGSEERQKRCQIRMMHVHDEPIIFADARASDASSHFSKNDNPHNIMQA